MSDQNTARRRIGWALRMALPVGVLAVCAAILSREVGPEVWGGTLDHVRGVAPRTWALAALLTGASFWAVGRYDVIAHRHLDTGVPAARAQTSGVASIAVAQTLGFGLITGALARWRLLPQVSLVTALRLSAFVSVSFIVGWAVVTALACLVLDGPAWTLAPALITLAAACIAAGIAFRWPHVRLRSRGFAWPSLRAMAGIMLWTAIDTTCAAAALFVLLPAGAEIAFTSLLPVFLLALGAALIFNTPGGLGPFEVLMLQALPHVGAQDVLSSIFAFRIVYYACPAVLGVLAMVRVPRTGLRPTRAPARIIPCAFAQPEIGIMHQNGARICPTDTGAALLWRTGQTVTMLFDPLRGTPRASARALRQAAREANRLPLAYKVRACTAHALRRSGWTVMHIADEALVQTAIHDIATPRLRRLRRKCRSAEKAGLRILDAPPLPLSQMAAVDRAWQADHGPARGGTMGRYCPKYVQNQWVALAYSGGTLCAFATFHVNASGWTLDLMRQVPDAPDGTMHALVHQGILAAKRRGVPTVSLAAIPACPNPHIGFWRWAARVAVAHGSGPGLRQFKSTFAPRWSPRYAAARSWPALILGLADIAREVHRPAPLAPADMAHVHNVDEYYEVPSSIAS